MIDPSAILPALIPFAFAVLFLWLFWPRHRNCPRCGEGLSIFQSPFKKTNRQWLEGGFLCSNCGCESTWEGRPVIVEAAARYPERLARVMLVVGLLVPLIPAAFTLLCFARLLKWI